MNGFGPFSLDLPLSLLNQMASLRRNLLREISSYAISKPIQVNVSL
jgi:hypothetical protein